MKTRKKNKSSSCMGWNLHKWGSTQFYRNSSSEKYDCVFTPSSVRQRRKGRLAWFHLISRSCMDIYTGISYKEVEGNFSLHLRRNFNWNISQVMFSQTPEIKYTEKYYGKSKLSRNLSCNCTVEVRLIELHCRSDCKCLFFIILKQDAGPDPYEESRESESKFTAIYRIACTLCVPYFLE